MFKTALNSKIDEFSMFGFSGVAAWHPDGLMFNQNYNPEGAFYALAKELFEVLIE